MYWLPDEFSGSLVLLLKLLKSKIHQNYCYVNYTLKSFDFQCYFDFQITTSKMNFATRVLNPNSKASVLKKCYDKYSRFSYPFESCFPIRGLDGDDLLLLITAQCLSLVNLYGLLVFFYIFCQSFFFVYQERICPLYCPLSNNCKRLSFFSIFNIPKPTHLLLTTSNTWPIPNLCSTTELVMLFLRDTPAMYLNIRQTDLEVNFHLMCH